MREIQRAKFVRYDMVEVEYKGTKYPMCVVEVLKKNKQLHVKSMRFHNFELIVGFDDVKKIVDFRE